MLRQVNNRQHGNPPACKEIIECLPKDKVTQDWLDDVDNKDKDCSVCKD